MYDCLISDWMHSLMSGLYYSIRASSLAGYEDKASAGVCFFFFFFFGTWQRANLKS